jgi:ribosomal protein S18 acetylase RimI-like enzyme
MTIEDYERVVELWRRTEGIILSDTDEKQAMLRFLIRNPGLSLVAEVKDEVIAAILCSHDGRRGYLHHLAVDGRYRRQGLGSRLVQECLSLLEREGIVKCNIFILEQNERGIAFWEQNGFVLLPHFGWMQRAIGQEKTPDQARRTGAKDRTTQEQC